MSLPNKDSEIGFLSLENKSGLLKAATDSIEYGLDHGQPGQVDLGQYPESLHQWRASFVTIRLMKNLRGCIGTLKPVCPVLMDVSQNAYNAAFRDPRFPPLTRMDFEDASIEISILSFPEPLDFVSEADLIQKLRPGTDGLILEENGRQSTFLPSLWKELPEPSDFLRELKRKAGLPYDYWSDTMKFERYTAESFL